MNVVLANNLVREKDKMIKNGGGARGYIFEGLKTRQSLYESIFCDTL